MSTPAPLLRPQGLLGDFVTEQAAAFLVLLRAKVRQGPGVTVRRYGRAQGHT